MSPDARVVVCFFQEEFDFVCVSCMREHHDDHFPVVRYEPADAVQSVVLTCCECKRDVLVPLDFGQQLRNLDY